MRAFARLIRCAIVASGTRNARAISAVVRPPTARSVSGIADPGVSDGWQHRNRRTSESSSSTTDDGDVPSRAATTRSRFDAGAIRPPRIDQPARGAAREPALRLLRDSRAGPAVGGRDERLLDGVLRRVEVAVPARERAKDPRREVAQQVLDLTLRRQRWPPAVWAYSTISSGVDGPSSMIRRTWTGCCSGTPPGPGTAETRAAISRARSSDSTSTIW